MISFGDNTKRIFLDYISVVGEERLEQVLFRANYIIVRNVICDDTHFILFLKWHFIPIAVDVALDLVAFALSYQLVVQLSSLCCHFYRRFLALLLLLAAHLSPHTVA